MMKRAALLLLALLFSVPLVGCGGGSGLSGSNSALSTTSTSGSRAKGRAVVHVKWPVHAKTRLIPAGANSIKISIRKGDSEIASTTLTRPADGSPLVSTYAFQNLPLGSLTATASAYPNADGTGIAQAVGANTLLITANQDSPLTLTMDATIVGVSVTGASAVATGATDTLIAAAQDGSGAVVLIGPGALTWSSSDATKATIDPATGIATGVAPGLTTITATYQEGSISPVSVTFALTVTAPSSGPYAYVVDTGGSRIVKLDSAGNFVATYGGFGGANGSLFAPYAIASDSSGNLYIADSGNNRVVKLAADGTFLAGFSVLSGSGGTLSAPTGIAVHGSDLYVSDTGSNRVVKLALDGTYVSAISSFGGANGSLTTPYALAVDANAALYIADYGNNRVVKVDSSGTFVAAFTASSAMGGTFNTPTGVAVDTGGNVFVADFGNNQVVKLNSAGTFVAAYAAFGGANGSLNMPSGVALDSSGDLFIADSSNNRIVKLDSSGSFAAAYTTFGSSDTFQNPSGLLVK